MVATDPTVNVYEAVSIGTETMTHSESPVFHPAMCFHIAGWDLEELFLKVHATTITKTHIQVGLERCTILLLRHFPYLGSAHQSTSVLVFLSFDVHPLPSSMFSLLHPRQSFSPHIQTISISLDAYLIFSLICLPHLLWLWCTTPT